MTTRKLPFEPIRTERLILRPCLPGDSAAAYERRNLDEVARYQDWEMPYTLEQAERRTAELVAMDGPVDGSWWGLTVVDAADPARILGDVAMGITWGGRTAEVGYTFHPDHWGRGYATEAVDALIRYLFIEFGVHRVAASMHPDNTASARVVESCGLVAEGLTHGSYWVGDECTDDLLYGTTRVAWDEWRNRPRDRPRRVELTPITPDNQRTVSELATHRSQNRFVSPMLHNFGAALAPPSRNGAPMVPWLQAIEADGEIVGFLMASEMTSDHEHPFLWRFLIDRRHQRRGIGSVALDLFEERSRSLGASAVEVSWVEGAGSPAPVYLARGYVPTGRIVDGEIQAIKPLIAISG